LRDAAYNLACIHALLSIGKAGPKAEAKPTAEEERAAFGEEAIAFLERARGFGWDDLAKIREDEELDPIRDLPKFKALLAKWEEELAKKPSDEGQGED
ncbi:MAG: TPR end-of-group domain-containing protein, partial [Planctomycetota bacterium]